MGPAEQRLNARHAVHPHKQTDDDSNDFYDMPVSALFILIDSIAHRSHLRQFSRIRYFAFFSRRLLKARATFRSFFSLVAQATMLAFCMLHASV